MTAPTPRRGDPPADDVPAVLAACRARVLEREGIPMVVLLQDARPGRQLVVHDPVSLADGAALADLYDHYERGLDRPTTVDVLIVLSDQHVRARVEPP